MPPARDLVGQPFNRLTVLARHGTVKGKATWLCECSCPERSQIVVPTTNLTRLNTKSCGCLNIEKCIERIKVASIKHGHVVNKKKSRSYGSWSAMNQRCHNPNTKMYKYYGARGIYVCDRWRGKSGFENFLADMGERPLSKTLDRTDVNKNYEPSNCRWLTAKEQNNNRRNSLSVIAEHIRQAPRNCACLVCKAVDARIVLGKNNSGFGQPSRPD